MNDDQLVLHYYGDGLADDERRAVDEALASDEALRSRYANLCARLAAIDEDVEYSSAPVAAKARWHAAIADAARASEQASKPPAETRSRHRNWAPPMALAAALLLGIGIGARWDGAPGPELIEPTTPAASAAPRDRRPAFERGFILHMRASRDRIGELPAADDAQRAQLLAGMLEQNRLHERAARNAGAADLARLLRAFELLLLRMAADETASDDLARLQDQLDFELDATLLRLEPRSVPTTPAI